MGWKALVLAALGAMAIGVPSAAAAPAPGAGPVPLAPAAGQVLPAGGGVTFQVQVPAGAYSVWFAASSSPAVGANGVLANPTVNFQSFAPSGQPSIYSYTPTTLSRLPDQVGTIYWQAYIIDSRFDSDFYAEGPVVPLTLVEQRGPLTPAFGISNGKALYLNPSPLPYGVSAARLEELVRRSAARWNVRYLGLAGNQPGRRDGVSVVGFDYGTDYGALGVTTTFTRPVYRMRRVCRIRPTSTGGRRRVCRGVRYLAGRAKTGERDVQLSMIPAWQPGPRRPSSRETDLESTIIHELGHVAGNPHVSSGCVNSPMVPGLERGGYWRDRDQMGFYACG